MASLRVRKNKDGTPVNFKKPWRARVKLDWMEYFLGCYETKEEAEAVERQFKEYYKPQKTA